MQRILKYLFVSMIILYNFSTLLAQGSAGEKPVYESRYVVDMPTAGVLPVNSMSFAGIAFNQGGLMIEYNISFFKNLSLGLSYSGVNIIGNGTITGQNLPGFHIRYRIFNETLNRPAVLLGFSSQGRGIWNNGSSRFQTLSPGFFVSVSKNYTWALGSVAFHGGLNYSFEQTTSDKSPNLYLGLEQSIGSFAALNAEYNTNIDDGDKKFLREKGILNLAFRLTLSRGYTVELQLRDLLKHYANTNDITRFFALEYITKF